MSLPTQEEWAEAAAKSKSALENCTKDAVTEFCPGCGMPNDMGHDLRQGCEIEDAINRLSSLLTRAEQGGA